MNESLNKALKCLKSHKYQEAVILLEKIYYSQRTRENNYYYFWALFKSHQWKKALMVSNEYLDEYLKDDDKFYQYLDVLIYNGKILSIFKLYKELLPYLNSDEKAIFEDKLKNYDKYLTKDQQELKTRVIKKLKYLGAFDVSEQQKILHYIELLNPQELLLNAANDLKDENVIVLVRMSLLNSLREVQDQPLMVLNYVNQLIKIDPTQLLPLEKTKVYSQLKKEVLNSKKINESLKWKVIEEGKLYLMVLYSNLGDFNNSDLLKIILKPQTALSPSLSKLKQKIKSEINNLENLKN